MTRKPKYIPLRKLAGQWGIDFSNFRKMLIRDEIPMLQRVTPWSGGRIALCLDEQTYERVKRMFEERGYAPSDPEAWMWFDSVKLGPKNSTGNDF